MDDGINSNSAIMLSMKLREQEQEPYNKKLKGCG